MTSCRNDPRCEFCLPKFLSCGVVRLLEKQALSQPENPHSSMDGKLPSPSCHLRGWTRETEAPWSSLSPRESCCLHCQRDGREGSVLSWSEILKSHWSQTHSDSPADCCPLPWVRSGRTGSKTPLSVTCDFFLPRPSLFLVSDWDNLTNRFHQCPRPENCLICGLGALIPPLVTWPWAGHFPCSSFPVYGHRGRPTLASFMKGWEAQMQLSGQLHQGLSLQQDCAKLFPHRLSRSPQIAL